jgi:signal transduction histidine kinase
MPSPSPSEPRSSTDHPLASSAADETVRTLRAELIAQGAFLDGLVASLGAVTESRDPTEVLELTARQAHELFAADATLVLAPAPGRAVLRPLAAAGLALGPIAELEVALDEPSSLIALAARDRAAGAGPVEDHSVDAICAQIRPTALLAAPLLVGDRLHALLVLLDLGSEHRFGAAELSRATVFCDFAARAVESAALFERVEALLAQARIREAERADLSRRVVSAEQEERRRLSLFLHDGPVQTLSGIGMMLDAAGEEIEAGHPAEAAQLLQTARSRQQEVVRSVRELSFALEPWTLRDQGFATALQAIADRFQTDHSVTVALDVADADTLSHDDQVYLFQIVREAMHNALKHAGGSRIDVVVTGSPAAGLEAFVRDDGHGFGPPPDDGLPHHGMEAMHERAAILGGRLDIDSVAGTGTTVRVLIGPGVLQQGEPGDD